MVRDAEIHAAQRALERGDLVGVPTETVYGLAADASNADAVSKIFEAKGRPADHPLIVHVAFDGWRATLERLTNDASEVALALAERFWPGPLTLVFRKSERVGTFVTGGLDTVGLRCPDSPLMQKLLAGFPDGLAAPSANRFMGVSPTTAAHVRADLGNSVALVLDGGPSLVGVESTIVDSTCCPLLMLRPGAIALEALQKAVGEGQVVGQPRRGQSITRSPGQLAAHYQPQARVLPLSPNVFARLLPDLVATDAVATLACGPGHENAARMARELYATFREADRRGQTFVVVEWPPEHGLGVAIADRLRRASFGHDLQALQRELERLIASR